MRVAKHGLDVGVAVHLPELQLGLKCTGALAHPRVVVEAFLAHGVKTQQKLGGSTCRPQRAHPQIHRRHLFTVDADIQQRGAGAGQQGIKVHGVKLG